MTKLNCNVTSCVHNADDCCCKNSIVVEGQTARDKCDTCCASFEEDKGEAFTNLFKTPENRLEVDCEAINCVYNERRRCVAEHIGIGGGKASSAGQTECTSFKAK